MKRIVSIISAMTLVLAATCLVGCSSSLSPSEVTAKALDQIKAQDFAALQSYYAGDASELQLSDVADSLDGFDLSDLSTEEQAVAKKVLDVVTDFDYEIGDEAVDGDTATVEVTISGHDLGGAFERALTSYFSSAFTAALSGASQEELSAMMLDAFGSEVDALAEKDHVATTTVALTKVDGEWKVKELSEDNLDCLLGGLVSSAKSLASAFNSMSSAS